MNVQIKKRFERVFSEIIKVDIPEEGLNGEENLLNLGVNSIAFIKTLVAVEQEYNIEFSDEDLDFAGFETVNDLMGLLEKKLSEK